MLAQRTMQASLRRFAARPLLMQVRASTTAASSDASGKSGVAGGSTPQLVEQRLKRPVAPHLGIYKWQVTWIGSSLNRITGTVLSGGFYIFGFGYLVQPLLGAHVFDSATMIAGVASMGLVSKFLLKFGLAWPFAYHSFNGIRAITNAQVRVTGWVVLGISTVSAVGLALVGLN